MGRKVIIRHPPRWHHRSPARLPTQKIKVRPFKWRLIPETRNPLLLNARKQGRQSQQPQRKQTWIRERFIQMRTLRYYASGRQLCCQRGYPDWRSRASNQRGCDCSWCREETSWKSSEGQHSLLRDWNSTNQLRVQWRRPKAVDGSQQH